MDTLLYKSIHSIFCCCFKYLEKPCSSEIKLCYQRLFFQQMVTIENDVITPNYSGHRKTLSTAYLVSCGPPFVSGLKADQMQRIRLRIFKCKEVTPKKMVLQQIEIGQDMFPLSLKLHAHFNFCSQYRPFVEYASNHTAYVQQAQQHRSHCKQKEAEENFKRCCLHVVQTCHCIALNVIKIHVLQ